MSHYEELRDAAFKVQYHPDPYVSGAAEEELHVELENAADDMQRLWRATRSAYKVAHGWYDEPAHFMCVACGGRSPQFSSWGDDYDEEAGYPRGITIEDVDHKPDCPHEALRPLFGE